MIHLDLAKIFRLKGLTSPYIISYLDFLNLNHTLTLPKFLSSLKLGLIWHDLCLLCFLPVRFTRMRASLRNQNKCKPSIDYDIINVSIQYIYYYYFTEKASMVFQWVTYDENLEKRHPVHNGHIYLNDIRVTDIFRSVIMLKFFLIGIKHSQQ